MEQLLAFYRQAYGGGRERSLESHGIASSSLISENLSSCTLIRYDLSSCTLVFLLIKVAST